ncbi:MAG: TPM domain-containing protein [Spirochaetes bacterium]|jgi:uncharacterized protein|nr:TPM domain-containing protein [Spirochaetota bacterium]
MDTKITVYPLLFIIILASMVLSPPLSGQTIPVITHPVNDYANIIPPKREVTIAAMLVAHREKTGVHAAVLTVPTTQPMSIEEFSIKVAEKWGGGSKERDDGLLFTVAVDDRRMRIEVGYGLEGYLTDLRAGRILNGIREDFRNNDYGGGIEKAVEQIIAATDELRPGQDVPAAARVRGAISIFILRFHMIYVIMGAAAGFLFVLFKRRQAHRLIIGEKTAAPRWRRIVSILNTILVLLGIFAVIPVLLQLFLPGVNLWAPGLFITGALVGIGISGVIMTPPWSVAAMVRAVIPATISLAGIVVCLHVLKPLPDTETIQESILLAILIHVNVFQLMFIFLDSEGGSGDGGSWSSGDSSSSSDSGDSSWSGGGGDFGGGGASSSW